MRARIIPLAWACLAIGIHSALLTASAQPLPAPVDNAQVTHAFAAYSAVKPGSYHAGVVSSSVSAHVGPGDYPQCTSLRSGQQFKAVASTLSNYPTDRARWYLVEAEDGSLFPYPGGGEIPRVWICEGLPGQRWWSYTGRQTSGSSSAHILQTQRRWKRSPCGCACGTRVAASRC